MPNQKKIETLQKLTEKLAKAKTFVLTDYRGLTHQQMEKLRKGVKKAGGDFIVAKNTLLKLAVEKTNLPQGPELESQLFGPIAILVSYQDEIAPLKEVARFIKQFQLPALKIGLLSGKIIEAKELIAIANLPGREVLLERLVGQLNSPLYRLHYALTWNLRKLVLTLKAVENTKH